MEEEKKHCLNCSRLITGRSDKKFCSDSCRTMFNNRIYRERNDELIRIDRILMRLILDIRRTDTAASYARILGFKKTAAPLLKAIRQNSRIPVITRPAPDERKLTAEALAGFRTDLRASELARHIRETSLGRNIRNEYTRGLILDPE